VKAIQTYGWLFLLEVVIKENFFDVNNITGLAEEIRNVNNKNKKVVELKKSALIIVDMQKYFTLKESPCYVSTIPSIKIVIKNIYNEYIKAERPVIATRHFNTENDRAMKTMFKHLLSIYDPLYQLDEEIEKLSSKVIDKHTYDAFYETELQRILVDENTEQVVVCGVLTERCVDTTVRSAFVRGYEVFVPIDATTTYREINYRASLNALASGSANIIVSEEIK